VLLEKDEKKKKRRAAGFVSFRGRKARLHCHIGRRKNRVLCRVVMIDYDMSYDADSFLRRSWVALGQSYKGRSSR